MEDPKSGHAPHGRAPDIAEKLDRAESAHHAAERRLGEELYDNIARGDDAFRAGFAERDAMLDRIKERIAATASRMRKGKASAG